MAKFKKSDGFKQEYCCKILNVGELTPVEGSDFLVKTEIDGFPIVVNKEDVHEGDLMIYAATETVLAEKFLSVNNLFDISNRSKNANAAEVEAIMKEYAPMKAEAEKLKIEKKNVKASMEQLSKRAKKLEKDSKKDPTLMEKAEEAYKRSMEKTTILSDLETRIKALQQQGDPIVKKATKLCGFFNKYGRVKCICLRGQNSFGFLFTPQSLFKYNSSITMEDLKENVDTEFDMIDDEVFVKAFVPPVKEDHSSKKGEGKKATGFDRIMGPFAFHYDTQPMGKHMDALKPETVIDVTVKVHGTSAIISSTEVRQPKKLPVFKRIWNWVVDTTGFLRKTRITDYDVVFGPVYASRTVIKNRYINKGVGGGFYGVDIWSEYGDIIYPYLEQGMTVYGEICGYLTNSESPIQKAYDYGCKKGENKFMPYRITSTEDGKVREWEVKEVLVWTNNLKKRMIENNDEENSNRILPIQVLYHGTLEDLYPELDPENHWRDNALSQMKSDKVHFGMEQYEPLCINKVPREGVCIRIEGDLIKEAFKLKTQAFLFAEAIEMDNGSVDIEMAQGNY